MIELLTLLLTFVLVQASQSAPATAIEQAAAEFPQEDGMLWSLVSGGLNAKAAKRALAEAPASPETLRVVAQDRRLDDVLVVLRAIVDGDKRRIPDAFAALGDTAWSFRGNDEAMTRRRDTLRQIVADAEKQLAALPREDAARAARVILNLRSELVPSVPGAYAARLARFLEEYRGTETAVLAEVETILEPGNSDRRASMQWRLDALEAFAGAHLGTAAGAKALYLAGREWHSGNTLGVLEPHRADPINRFTRVMAIVNRLESGEFPDCEWVRKAPELIVEFFFSPDDVIAPASVDRMIGAYEQFVRRRFARGGVRFGQDSIDYLVTVKLPELYARRSNALAEGERFLAELEKAAQDPSAVRYLRALFYRNGFDRAPQEEASDEVAERDRKMRAEFASLANAGTGLYSRVALASIASVHLVDGRYAEAREAFEKYLAAYPASPWAWVAAVRAGQAAEALGDPEVAAVRYLKAAASDLPLAKVLGHEYAARAYESAGRFEKALAEHERALALWDDDFGFAQQRYSTYVNRPATRTDPFIRADDSADVVRASLPPRIAELRRALSIPGGATLERGRTLLARERFDESIDVLGGIPRQHPGSPAVPEAQSLARRARLERALAAADVERPDANEDQALTEFEALAREPLDFAVTAARIARASILWKRGDAASAEAGMSAALTDWQTHQRLSTPANPIEDDVAEIRRVVFLPKGGPIYGDGRWNAFEWSRDVAPFVLLSASVPAKMHDGQTVIVRLVQTLPGTDKALFFDAGEIALLQRMIPALGGTRRREPVAIMETPNQPVGDSMQILRLWTKFFAARPGHWGGWEIETYPHITEIQFTNAERTKAAVKVTIGYSGATVELEKDNGKWVAKRLVSQWIT
jgi:tetratricopeptide (TPR) repeat protein